jgi:hypothetical protein
MQDRVLLSLAASGGFGDLSEAASSRRSQVARFIGKSARQCVERLLFLAADASPPPEAVKEGNTLVLLGLPVDRRDHRRGDGGDGDNKRQRR